jgi:hypothetical protein
MEGSRQTDADRETEQPSLTGSTLAKMLAPEEVQAGQYVTVLHEVAEFPSFYWFCDNVFLDPEEVIRMRYLPVDGGLPLKVRSVCLPFVLVKLPTGEERPLDLRKCRVARLTQRYATRAWKACKKSKSKRPAKSRK